MISITATSVTEYDGKFEWVITDRYDGAFDVAVACEGVWLCHTILAGTFERAEFLAGAVMGQHLLAEYMVAGR